MFIAGIYMYINYIYICTCIYYIYVHVYIIYIYVCTCIYLIYIIYYIYYILYIYNYIYCINIYTIPSHGWFIALFYPHLNGFF